MPRAIFRSLAAVVTGLMLVSGPATAQLAAPALDVPFVPTPQEVVDRMLELAQVRKGDYLIDLGSGDGRIPVTAAKRYGVRAYGVDLNPQRVREANENARENGVTDNVSFEEKNLFDTEIADADVLTMYLFASINLRLRPRILEELKPGSRVVSHAFNMGDWEPDRKDKVDSRDVYLWIVPAKVEGRWRVTDGGKAFVIDLKQKFQKIGGAAEVNGRSAPLFDTELNGAAITFTFDMGEGRPKTFSGRVDGNTMRAADAPGAASGRRSTDWTATRM